MNSIFEREKHIDVTFVDEDKSSPPTKKIISTNEENHLFWRRRLPTKTNNLHRQRKSPLSIKISHLCRWRKSYPPTDSYSNWSDHGCCSAIISTNQGEFANSHLKNHFWNIKEGDQNSVLRNLRKRNSGKRWKFKSSSFFLTKFFVW